MTNILLPPCNRGMFILKRSLFDKIIKIPKIRVHSSDLNKMLREAKKYLLKLEKLKPIQDDATDETFKMLLLNPTLKFEDNIVEKFENATVVYEDLLLKYDNWGANDILRSVLPENQEGLSSFSRIGHIIHLNLKDHLLPYKKLIGEVLREKTAGIRTVVNKVQTIDNTYRNFQFELLEGDPDYFVNVRENGVGFEFDFSTVYWNPRLAKEHENVVKLLNANDILYDVCAGVGPFAIPAAKKKCIVLANDLNPNSYKYLQRNATKNKVDRFVQAFNKDGNDFIKTEMKNDLIERWSSTTIAEKTRIHVTMNLPAMAVEFLPSFHGLLSDYDGPTNPLPLVHVYCFAKGVDDPKDIAKELVEQHLKNELRENLEGIYFVRNVAPNKNMMRVSFYLTSEILYATKNKRKCDDDDGYSEGVIVKCVKSDGEKGRKEEGRSSPERTTEAESTDKSSEKNC